jgi:hypothetical protein
MRGKGKPMKLFELRALVGNRTECLPVESQNLIGTIQICAARPRADHCHSVCWFDLIEDLLVCQMLPGFELTRVK